MQSGKCTSVLYSALLNKRQKGDHNIWDQITRAWESVFVYYLHIFVHVLILMVTKISLLLFPLYSRSPTQSRVIGAVRGVHSQFWGTISLYVPHMLSVNMTRELPHMLVVHYRFIQWRYSNVNLLLTCNNNLIYRNIFFIAYKI